MFININNSFESMQFLKFITEKNVYRNFLKLIVKDINE